MTTWVLGKESGVSTEQLPQGLFLPSTPCSIESLLVSSWGLDVYAGRVPRKRQGPPTALTWEAINQGATELPPPTPHRATGDGHGEEQDTGEGRGGGTGRSLLRCRMSWSRESRRLLFWRPWV